MRVADQLTFSTRSLVGARTRTLLMLLAMSIGVASVILLTALGEGARRYVVGEFEQLGTHLLIMLPGRSETTGGAPPLFGETPRDLTIADALALLREPTIVKVAPLAVGNAPVSFGGREREVTVIGATRAFFPIRHLDIGSGRALPELDPERAANVAVLGAGLRRELFGGESALGRWLRINDRRYRVIGVLAGGGHSLGQNLDDMIVIPVAAAQRLFDSPSLFRVLIQARSEREIDAAQEAARAIIRERHDGEDDVTIITQDALLATFDSVLRALTYTVGGIAAISLAVAGILIMNVMLVAVSQRVAEIGLLKALGASSRRVLQLFLIESVMLAGIGSLLGLGIGMAAIQLLHVTYPAFPVAAPLWAPVAAIAVAISTGLVFGALPARRAARLDPVIALNSK
jgi:putative ABC transport system permease protein